MTPTLDESIFQRYHAMEETELLTAEKLKGSDQALPGSFYLCFFYMSAFASSLSSFHRLFLSSKQWFVKKHSQKQCQLRMKKILITY